MKKLLTILGIILAFAAASQVNAQYRATILKESLLNQESFNKFNVISVKGSQTWRVDTRYGAVMSGNYNEQNYNNEDWLISPELNLLDKEDVKFSFQHTRGNRDVMWVGVAEGWYKVFATDHFTGDIATTNWVEIQNIPHEITRAWDFVSSGELEFPQSTISAHTRFAFRYISDSTQSATWEIKNVEVTRNDTVTPPPILPPTPYPDSVLKITTWNTEWLGCENSGPQDEELQIRNVADAIKAMKSDIICLQEVTQSNRYPSINTLLSLLGEEYDGNIVTSDGGDCGQNQGVIYRKSKVQLTNSQLFYIDDNNYRWNWSSGRYPALYEFNVLTQGRQIPIHVLNIHAKAFSDEDSYTRRKGGSEALKNILDKAAYNTKRIILIGDFNDWLIGTQCTSKNESPYKNFIDDKTNYAGLTNNLGYGRLIDNIVVSNELFNSVIWDSIYQETDVRYSINNFGSTTSDHTPVSAFFAFNKRTSVENQTLNSQIKVFPNPAKKEIIIRGIDGVKSNFEIYNMLGERVIKGNVTDGKAINISNLSTGIYVIKIGDYRTKFIKE
ncbi:MAG: endonuclease/exonuclease/phosphatase family protein [Bacteroidales bacterium]|jgi:endonuclease/exonuclease/phosphatase family metal-dependent hydrolase|nr:endonuclease/exonuclease/phosphatase family protein [Bacteroidales bacterium]